MLFFLYNKQINFSIKCPKWLLLNWVWLSVGDFCAFWNASCLTALLKACIDQDYMIYIQEGGPSLPTSCPLHSSNTPAWETNPEDPSLIYQSRPSVQLSSVAQSCPTLCDPMNRSTPGLPVHHRLPEFTQTHVHQVSDAILPSHPRSSPSPHALNPSQHQSLLQWVNSSHEVAKVLEFQL